MSNVRKLVCDHCDRGFEQQVKRGSNPSRYCSPRCKNSANARLRIQRNLNKAERRCYKCKRTLPTSAFGSASHSYCRSCGKDVQREWDKANPNLRAEYKRRSVAKAAAADPEYFRKLTLRKYRLTLAEFDRMLKSQGGRCAICLTDAPGGRHGTWHVDHDRDCCPRSWSCGKCVRGLLCDSCNLGLGKFGDDVDRLRAAATYISSSRQLKLLIA